LPHTERERHGVQRLAARSAPTARASRQAGVRDRTARASRQADVRDRPLADHAAHRPPGRRRGSARRGREGERWIS